MSVRMIAIDLDGTLFDSEQRVPAANRAALLEAQARGVCVVLSSGRMYSSVLAVARGIGLVGPVISSNGALARDTDGAPVFDRPLNARSLRLCYDYLTAKQAYYILCSGNTIFTSPHAMHIDHEGDWDSYLGEDGKIAVERLDSLEQLTRRSLRAHKIAVVDSREHYLRALRGDMERIEGVEINSAWSDNIEIMDAGVNKGAAVRALAAHLNIPMSDVMAIGDNENDLSMLEAAGVPVAMGNALDSVKAACRFVTLTNDEAGVAHAVRTLVLEA